MRPGARTPEELEALLEDAFVVRDGGAVAALFERGALLVDVGHEARGARQIAGWARETWSCGRTYLGAAPRVLQVGDTALVLTADGAGVARRRSDRAWRYAIALLASHDPKEEER